MVAIFLEGESGEHGERDDGLTYLGPHPSPLAQGLAGIVVFGDEVRRLSRVQTSSHPYIWKVALWGTPRDLHILDDLRGRFPSLDEVGKNRGWVIREGITVNGRSSNHAPELAKIRYVPTNAVQPFHVLSSQEERIDREVFHRPGDVRTYRGPHTLVRSGPTTGGFLASAFLPEDAVFQHGVFGIAGPREDTNYLKVACAYINSSLARYYHFLTTSTWGVERDVVRLAEHKTFPCAVPVEDADLLDSIVALVDRMQRTGVGRDWRRELDELVYSAYGVTSSERQTIEDLLGIAVDRHYRGLRGHGFETPSADDLTSYAQAYADVFEASTGGNSALRPVVYVGSPPYRAVSFHLAPRGAEGRRPQLASEPELDRLLVRLERVATEQHAQSLYFRRNIKVYEAEAIHVVKPAERRFWTRSAAHNDADETVGQLLRTLSPSSDGIAAPAT